jgi:sec-independent protein translocase protein TatB
MFPLEQGAFEMLLIGVIALIVVGPKDLPVMMRKIGQFTGKMRGLAAEFRASFDEMARQSELDELRKEVEALRTGAYTAPISAEIDQHLSDFNAYPTGYPSPPPEAAPTPLETTPTIELASDVSPDPAPRAEVATKKLRVKKAVASSEAPNIAPKPRAPRKPKPAPAASSADEVKG